MADLKTKYGFTLKNVTDKDLEILEKLSTDKYFREEDEEVTRETLEIIRRGLEEEEKNSKDVPAYFFINPNNSPHYELIGKFFKSKTVAGALLRMRDYGKKNNITSPYDDIKDNLYFEIQSRNKHKKLMVLKELIQRMEGEPNKNLGLPTEKEIKLQLKDNAFIGCVGDDKRLLEELIANHECDDEESGWTQIFCTPKIDIVE